MFLQELVCSSSTHFPSIALHSDFEPAVCRVQEELKESTERRKQLADKLQGLGEEHTPVIQTSQLPHVFELFITQRRLNVANDPQDLSQENV